MKTPEVVIFYPTSRPHWRKWLEANHDTQPAVWVVFHKKQSGMPTISWSDAVDEALCFGWVDSKKLPVDDTTFKQFFSRRKKQSTWSKINKQKIQRLLAEGLIMKAGLESIETAKQNGSWTVLDDVEELIIPKDLKEAFKTRPGSEAYFLSLSRSVKKGMLQWLVLAKRPETREKRISEIAELAAQKQKPKQF